MNNIKESKDYQQYLDVVWRGKDSIINMGNYPFANNVEVMRVILEESMDGKEFCYAGKDVKNNKEICKMMLDMEEDFFYFKHCGENIRRDKEFIEELIDNRGFNDVSNILINMHDDLKKDVDYCMNLLEEHKGIFRLSDFHDDAKLFETFKIIEETNPKCLENLWDDYSENGTYIDREEQLIIEAGYDSGLDFDDRF